MYTVTTNPSWILYTATAIQNYILSTATTNQNSIFLNNVPNKTKYCTQLKQNIFHREMSKNIILIYLQNYNIIYTVLFCPSNGSHELYYKPRPWRWSHAQQPGHGWPTSCWPSPGTGSGSCRPLMTQEVPNWPSVPATREPTWLYC